MLKEGYLECSYLPGCESSLTYSLSKKAFRESIGDKGNLAREQRKSTSPAHDLALIEIRRWFLAQPRVTKFLPENGLAAGAFDEIAGIKALRALNPDAIIEIEYGGKPVLLPLEYEASEKFKARYERTIRRYYQHPEVQAVLVLANKPYTIEKLKRLEKAEKGPHRFFYSLWDSTDSEIKFQNLDEIELSLRD